MVSKNVLIILPQNKFQDEELLTLKKHLNEEQIVTKIVTCLRNRATGVGGTTIFPDMIIDEIDARDFNAIVLIGGVGSIEHWHNTKILNMLKLAYELNKLICAICLAPVTLANASILKNKKATAYKPAASYLRSKGVIYTGSPVEVCDNIITACGPEASRGFARAIIDYLNSRERKSDNKL